MELTLNKSRLTKKKGVQRFVFAIVWLFFMLYALTFVYVFVWAFISTFKTQIEYTLNPLQLPHFLKEVGFSSYVKAFTELNVNGTNFIGLTFNSIWFAVGTTIINLFTTSCTAYVVAKYRFVGRKLLYALGIFIMLIPVVGAMPANYKLLSDLNIINTPLILISYASGFGFNFLIFYGYFNSVSKEYGEAVLIDGGGHFTIFFKIVIPQALPSFVALGILSFIGNWNDYYTPILYLESFPTLSSGLFQYQSAMQYAGDYPTYYAGVLISIIPIIIIYCAFQETIMENTVAGGLKG